MSLNLYKCKIMDLTKLTIEELSHYERLTKIVCAFYENSIKRYDGSIIENEEDEYKKYKSFNDRYRKIQEEIERRIEKI